MKKVLVFGTFDKLHLGHEYFLKKAKEHGDFLAVVVARDVTVNAVKGRFPVNSEIKRLAAIRDLKYVDQAILGNPGDKYVVVHMINPDIICLGYDQSSFTENLEKNLKERGLSPKIIRLDGFMPEKYKSSKL